MNDQPNVQLVKQAYQLFKAGDIASFLNLLTENVLWVLPRMANVPFAGTWKGRQQVRQFFSRLREVQEVVEFAPEEFIAQGDKVVVWNTSRCASMQPVKPPAQIGYTFGQSKGTEPAPFANT